MEASITVELATREEVGTSIAAFFFDWAQAPPVSFRVEFHNGSSSSQTIPAFYDPAAALEIAFQNPITVSSPFNPDTVADVVPYSSNTTLVTLDTPVAVGGADGARYATLWIRGNQGIVGEDKFNGSEPGAAVAEWVIIVVDEDLEGDRKRDVIARGSDEKMKGKVEEKREEGGFEADQGEGKAKGEKVMQGGAGTMHMTMTDTARDAEVRRLGGYVKRAVEERRMRRVMRRRS